MCIIDAVSLKTLSRTRRRGFYMHTSPPPLPGISDVCELLWSFATGRAARVRAKKEKFRYAALGLQVLRKKKRKSIYRECFSKRPVVAFRAVNTVAPWTVRASKRTRRCRDTGFHLMAIHDFLTDSVSGGLNPPKSPVVCGVSIGQREKSVRLSPTNRVRRFSAKCNNFETPRLTYFEMKLYR